LNKENVIGITSKFKKVLERNKMPYKCSLDANTLKKAKDELNEDPTQRASQIQALREWVQRQPHLTSRTDDEFLLRFLRVAKFSQLKAQERLDNFWTVRTSPINGVPEWYSDMDPLLEKNQKMLDMGLTILLPGRDDENRRVTLVRTGGYDPKLVSLGEVLKTGNMVADASVMDELDQIHGACVLLDFTEFSSAHIFAWDRETIRKASKTWQDVFPVRTKAIHYYNTGTVFNTLQPIFSFFMKEKTKQRLLFHRDSLESLHSKIPKRMLPTEMGGDAGSLQSLIENTKKMVISKRDELILNERSGKVDESKRQKAEAAQITGTFRKLNVD